MMNSNRCGKVVNQRLILYKDPIKILHLEGYPSLYAHPIEFLLLDCHSQCSKCDWLYDRLHVNVL